MHVTGDLSLAGTLAVSLVGFTPSAGQSFDILDWGSLSGTFASISLPALPGLAWDMSQLYSTGVLAVVAPGFQAADFDEDGDVDGNDLRAGGTTSPAEQLTRPAMPTRMAMPTAPISSYGNGSWVRLIWRFTPLPQSPNQRLHIFSSGRRRVCAVWAAKSGGRKLEHTTATDRSCGRWTARLPRPTCARQWLPTEIANPEQSSPRDRPLDHLSSARTSLAAQSGR